MQNAVLTARKKLGISVMTLAHRSRVSRWRIAEAELGNVELTPEEMSRMQRALWDYWTEKGRSMVVLLGEGGSIGVTN
jgi:predicted transcriptional regulator